MFPGYTVHDVVLPRDWFLSAYLETSERVARGAGP